LLDELLTGRLFKPIKQRLLTSFSSVLDTVVFTLMAPVLMIFHARFVVYTLLGKGVSWVAQQRKLNGGVDWWEILLTFGPITLLGVVWGIVGWFISSTFLLWLSPILICLILAVPMAGLVSGRHSGRRMGLFLSPEEDDPPTVLNTMETHLEEVNDRLPLQPELEKYFGLLQVCLDPYVNGLHVSLLRKRRNIQVSRDYLDALASRLVREGPQALKPQEIKAMIYDTETVTNLHYRLWSAADNDLAPFWYLAIRQYNVAATNPFAHLLAQRQETKRLE
jgi:membrane glycosyltransferase